MKNLLLITFIIAGQAAFAGTAVITCDQGTRTERADSLQKIEYKIDLETGVVALGCSEKLNGSFCESIRMDLSHSMPALTVDCRNRNDVVQDTVRFYLAQEDEFENQVQIQVSRSCATGKILVPAQMKANILSYQSGDFFSGTAPFENEVVNCSALLPATRR